MDDEAGAVGVMAQAHQFCCNMMGRPAFMGRYQHQLVDANVGTLQMRSVGGFERNKDAGHST
jgi:hypothetical protein